VTQAGPSLIRLPELFMYRLSIPLMLLCAGSVLACVPALGQERAARQTVRVTGRGEVSARPDLAVVTLGVITAAKSASEAMQTNAKAASALVAALKDKGIAPKDIATSSIDLASEYSYDNQNKTPPRLIGYKASNRVEVRLREIDKVGELLDQAVASGVNEIRGPVFTFANPGKLRDEARRLAAIDATKNAGIFAEGLGLKLGKVVNLSEGSNAAEPRPVVMARMAADVASAPPVEAGEQDVTVNVTAIFELEP
jgi:uncharacterized protein YggE